MSIKLPTISWEVIISNTSVVSGEDYRYNCTLQPININDPGYGQLDVGYYIVDFIGHIFQIEEVNGYDIKVYDLLEDTQYTGPYNDKNGYVYSSLKEAALVAQAKLNRLDKSAEDFVRNLILENNDTFLFLNDTPDTYTDQAFKTLQVKEDLTGLEFTKDLKLDSINEFTTDNGVLIDDLLIKDGRAFNIDATAPTLNNELANKLYVDDEISKILIETDIIPKLTDLGTNNSSLWLINPKGVYYNGNTYIVYNDYDDNLRKIAKYDHADRTWTTATWTQTLFTDGLYNDDGRDYAHSAPTVLIDSDGYINIVYTGYKNNKVYFIKSTNPEDISSWGSEVLVETLTGGDYGSYPILFEINSTLVYFYRSGNSSGNRTISRAISNDGGTTWSNIIDITQEYPYFQIRKDHNDRIHISWHIRPGTSNENIYYVYSDDITSASPTWKTADGTTVTIPLISTDALVFDSYSWDNCYLLGCIPDDQQGIHIFAYLSDSVDTDQLIHFRWNGSSWVQTVIAEEQLMSWSSGGAIQGDVKFQDANIYLLSEYLQDGISENKEWVSYDRGLSWEFNRYVTVGSAATTANPFYIRDSREYGWFEGSDDYGVGKKIYKGELPYGDMKISIYDRLYEKGDLLTFSDRYTNLPVGADGQILSADSAEITGLKWVDAPNTMVYPSAGIAVSTGTAWSTSISGTSSQFVKGDGSLDSNTYLTSQYWTQSGNDIYYNDGNVGIGTTNPVKKLDISGDAILNNNGLFLRTNTQELNGAPKYGIGLSNIVSSTNYYTQISDYYGLTFATEDNQRLTITRGGNVLIGTTTDSGYKLDINGTGRFTGQITADGFINPFEALTSGSTTWNCSTGLSKTWSVSANATLTLSNLVNGMYGDVKITVTNTPTITLTASGITFKGNGSLSSLSAGIYHLCWVCTSSSTVEWNIAKYE
jgi:hypothetical protein